MGGAFGQLVLGERLGLFVAAAWSQQIQCHSEIGHMAFQISEWKERLGAYRPFSTNLGRREHATRQLS